MCAYVCICVQCVYMRICAHVHICTYVHVALGKRYVLVGKHSSALGSSMFKKVHNIESSRNYHGVQSKTQVFTQLLQIRVKSGSEFPGKIRSSHCLFRHKQHPKSPAVAACFFSKHHNNLWPRYGSQSRYPEALACGRLGRLRHRRLPWASLNRHIR